MRSIRIVSSGQRGFLLLPPFGEGRSVISSLSYGLSVPSAAVLLPTDQWDRHLLLGRVGRLEDLCFPEIESLSSPGFDPNSFSFLQREAWTWF
jgi:hypothetical protein